MQTDILQINRLYQCNGKEPADCKDRSRYCYYYVKKNYCKVHKAYMNHNCRKSCNTCGRSNLDYLVPLIMNCFFLGVCQDYEKHCPSWATIGLCENRRYAYYMKITCPKTCKKCTWISHSYFDSKLDSYNYEIWFVEEYWFI